MKLSYKFSYTTIISLLIFIGCSQSNQKQQPSDPFNDLPVLETSILVDINDREAAQSGKFHFGSKYFRDMAISKEGQYFVSNVRNRNILHFDENGQFIARMGSEGKGPGAFQVSPHFDIASQDTLFALDYRSQIVNKFINTDHWEYANSFQLEKRNMTRPEQILQLNDEQLAVMYTPHSRQLINAEDLSQFQQSIDLLTTDGSMIRDSVLVVPISQSSVYRAKGGASVVQDVPFGVNSIVEVGPDSEFYHLLTDKFEISIFDTAGQISDQISHSNYSIALTEDQRWSAIEEAVSVNMGSESENQAMKEQLFNEMPASAHPLNDMHVDRDTGHIIVKRSDLYPGPNWLLLDAQGKRVGKFNLDESMNVFDFRGGKIIGALMRDDEEALPTVRVVTLPETTINRPR